jgi:Flp pilus assembly protein TadB
VVRERQAWRAERHAQAAQARLSARMLTVLPLVVAGWGLVSGPRARQTYVESPATSVFAGLGVALNLVGWMWMRRLVRGPSVA